MLPDAIATDYDRTLTTPELEDVPEALDALREARAQGVRVVVLSGRSLDLLEARVGSVADCIVAENGATLRAPDGSIRELAAPFVVPATFPFDVERGRALVSTDLRHEDALRGALAHADVELVRNRDRVMALPRGVTKATGLAAALAVLGVDAARCVAFGDGENDAPMLLACGRRVAVANAAPELRRIAHEATVRPGGAGVAAWLRANVLAANEASA